MSEGNIVLIGMPGSGKSTIGVILAKVMSMRFIDTDVLIQVQEGRSLQEIIDSKGLEAFLCIEERTVLSLACTKTVIATGGSVVYSRRAMEHLGSSGTIIHLDLSLDLIEKRLKNFANRGVVRRPGQCLSELYNERVPLYRRYAEIDVDCSGKNHEEVISAILSAMRGG
ncbi:MAG: shikimate kinase [bacterium]